MSDDDASYEDEDNNNVQPPPMDTNGIFKNPMEVFGLGVMIFIAVWVVFISIGMSLSMGWFAGMRIMGVE